MGRRFGDERGSIMLALFAILVVGAVVVLLAALILAAQSDTRSSTGFEQALQGAETGLDRMTAQVKQNRSPSASPR